MSAFAQVFENPFYDEDGVLVDEDYEWEDVDYNEELELEELSPFATINS
jgi:hypothetical protein